MSFCLISIGKALHYSILCLILFVHHPERKDKLDERLTALLIDNQFQKKVKGLGLTITSLKELKRALIKDTFADLRGENG